MPGLAPGPSGEERDSRWRIELLGALSAERDGRVVTHFETRKAGALLAYLAFYADRRHPRDVLAELSSGQTRTRTPPARGSGRRWHPCAASSNRQVMPPPASTMRLRS
jgi:hypothetical protein